MTSCYSKSFVFNMLSSVILICLNFGGLEAAIPAQHELAQGESVYIYVDSLYQGASKDVKSTYKDDIGKKKVKWKVKKAKLNTYTKLALNVEKELIKSKADLFILAMGIDELWNFKEDKATELSIESYKASVQATVNALKAADKKVILLTPHQISAGQNTQANERLKAAADIITTICSSAEIPVADIYSSFDKKNKTGDPGKHNKGITTKDGLKLNDAGEQIVINSLGKLLALSASGPSKKANIDRQLAKGDKIAFVAPEQVRHQAQPLSLQIKAHYKTEMGVEAPHVAGVFAGKQFWYTKEESIRFADKYLDVIKSLKPSLVIVYPGRDILGSRKYIESLDNGTYLKQLRMHIQNIQEITNAPIFLCTPLIWKEDDAANLVVVDGPNYQACQKWANHIKSVANEFNLEVIDMHKNCVDFINKQGVAKANFAGRRTTWQGQTTYTDIDYDQSAKDMLLGSICDALNFDYHGTKIK